MARTLVVAALGASLLAWSWMSLESGGDAGQATLVVVLAIATACVARRALRVAACVVALLLTGAIAFGLGPVWALPARMLSRFGDGFLEFYDYQVPFDPSSHPRMHGVLLIALFAFTLAFALAVAARRPGLAAIVLVVGVGWPGTLLPGHDLWRGAVGGRDARPPGRANGDAIDGVDVPLRQAGCGAVPQVGPVRIQQQEGRQHVAGLFLDHPA